MEKYKVSLIVAIYKSEDFLNKLIESMINQTYKNLEIILVDDGSPDNSGKICDEYAKKDNRIKVIHKKNGGTCEARNYGLKASTGDYFSIIDGDDWLCEDYVEYLMNIINSTGAEMAMTHNIFTTRDQIQVPEDKIEILTPEDATIKLIYPGIEIGPWNKMYKKEIIEINHKHQLELLSAQNGNDITQNLIGAFAGEIAKSPEVKAEVLRGMKNANNKKKGKR